MFWFVLEAAIALAILVFIVWWTWPRKPKPPAGHDSERG